MIIVYSHLPVIEEILIERLTKYLFGDCKWADQYPNFKNLRINNEYPWVPYLANSDFYTKGYLDLSEVPDLFPSVTIVTSHDSKSPTLFVSLKETTLLKEDLDDFKAQAEDGGYLISPEALLAIETHFETNDFLYGTNIIYQARDSISIDITADDDSDVKNRLYDLIRLFLIGHGNMELKKDLDIEIIEHSVNGNRSGTYNIEFGRALRGSSIQLEADYNISQVYYDTDSGLITDVIIDHTVS